VTAEPPDAVAARLAARIDELSRALSRAGVPLEERARLLENAALAAVQAVMLDARQVPEPAAPAPVTPIEAAPSLRSVA
jgi:hypothetical protein